MKSKNLHRRLSGSNAVAPLRPQPLYIRGSTSSPLLLSSPYNIVIGMIGKYLVVEGEGRDTVAMASPMVSRPLEVALARKNSKRACFSRERPRYSGR